MIECKLLMKQFLSKATTTTNSMQLRLIHPNLKTMASTHLKLLTSFTITILLSSSLSTSQTTETIIQEICQHTEDPTFCNSTFHQNLPRYPPTIPGLTELTLTQASINVTNTLAFVKEEIPVEKDAKVVERLKACKDGYNTVEYNSKKSLEAFASGDYKGLEVFVAGMLTEQTLCYENFQEEPYRKNRVFEMSREVKILIIMAAIAEGYLVE